MDAWMNRSVGRQVCINLHIHTRIHTCMPLYTYLPMYLSIYLPTYTCLALSLAIYMRMYYEKSPPAPALKQPSLEVVRPPYRPDPEDLRGSVVMGAAVLCIRSAQIWAEHRRGPGLPKSSKVRNTPQTGPPILAL